MGLDVLDPTIGAKVHGHVAMEIATHPTEKIDVLDADAAHHRLRVARQLGLKCVFEVDVKWSGEGNRIAIDRGHLHHLVERTILTYKPTPRTAARRIVLWPPENIGMVIRNLVNKDYFANLYSGIARER